MIKLTQYIAPNNNPDSYLKLTPWCITIEYIKADGKPEFKSITEPEVIKVVLSEEWKEQVKDNMGMNIALITIEENES